MSTPLSVLGLRKLCAGARAQDNFFIVSFLVVFALAYV